MAEALVVGALVSGFANVVLDRLISPEFVNLVVGKKLDRKLVDRLRTALLAAEALVADAEQKQFGNDRVRKWLDGLRDALYTADDLLDRVFIKAEIRSKVRTHLPSFLNLSDRKMVTKIEEVVKTIEDLQKLKDTLGLREIPTGSSSWRPPSTSLVKGNVYGRDADQQALIKMLNDNNHHNLSVSSIVGMGGVGKTTLAQWLYNNKDLMDGFDLKAWICVSENFDVVETTKNVIKGISSGVCSLESFDLLQQHLKEKLSEKKFFIVLDDVWSEDVDKWSSFVTPFQHGRKGSTILLTTRKENVGRIVQHYNSYTLKELSDDYCWSIFADNASFPESNGSSELEEIGRKIVKRCDGLPLAAETLGRLLRSERRVGEWNKILSNDIWEFPMSNSKIVPALLISYYHLSAHLKRCFVYCSLYPKDYQFDKDELILLWMAEDLLRPPKRGETLEEVGCECFDNLASRLFFKQVKNDDEKYFLMHDLMHDLAIFLAGKFYCRLSEGLGEKEEMSILTRHLSHDHSISKTIRSSNKIESLRTSLHINNGRRLQKECATLQWDILSKNKYLRVLSFDILNIFPNSIAKLIQLRYLDLSRSKIEVLPQSLCNLCNLQSLKLRECWSLTMLPSSIGELIHLRYLELSGSAVKTLPESLCKLCNLQTLKLEDCSKLTMLPNGMCNLVSLRHLDIRKTPLKEMPKGMSKMKQLHILSYYMVGKDEVNGIQELGGLVNLHGSFEIQKLENVGDVNEARSARIIDKKHIDDLLLEWSSGDDVVSDTETERDILHNLQPHSGLKKFTIKGYKSKLFPDWIGHSFYQNMTNVSLKSCKNCCMLPSLGQLPSLKSLSIQGFDQLKCVGDEFYQNEDDHSLHIAPFPSLERLEFNYMSCWEEWHLPESKAFPQLKWLRITNCPKLKGDMVNPILMSIISSSSDASKVRKVQIREDYPGLDIGTSLHGDTVSIRGCQSSVECAIKAMISINHLTSLQEIEFLGCWSVVSLQGNCLPKSLQKLTIECYSELELLQQQEKYDLVELQIKYSCDSLSSFLLDAFPKLKILAFRECKNLKSVSMSEPSHAALQSLYIFYCTKLVSFPEEGLAAPNMTHLCVRDCHKLEALPRGMNSLLPCLQSLDIRGCPNITSLPEGGLPSNLKELSVGACEQQLSNLSWMGNLDTLTHLTVDDTWCESKIKSYPEAGSLPRLPSLTTLKISSLCKLETLDCKQLLCLTSLQQLHIRYCPELENMAGEKLPSSLLLLKIERCTLLGKHCKNKHQQIWPKISHIPEIKVID
ncbi:putative disease resistance RPP13-like protein 1 [Arachis hypogaea]|uniref:putative disease resistance RPP13-like protein 1 n=2 Tax=Arachis TaxID=3817 RepID=UPI000DECF2DC|nr:putative disease resistance protein At3g14460 [Arachis hypogaea]XP_025631535.1 putative disease resistance protein At3g14460 [Arachis hypogaea]QHO22347.1 Putative disease resistance RPP13-like protein [Arachis hypogaea]